MPKHIARGFLIDPEKKSIVHIHHDTKDYKEIYKIIGCAPSPFTIIHLPNNDVIFVDDEGLLKDPRYFFNIEGYGQPIAGKGLVVGTDENGDTVSAKISFQEIKDIISFSEHKLLDLKTTEVKHGDAYIIRTEPIFGPPEES